MTTKTAVNSPKSIVTEAGTVEIESIFAASWGYEQTNVSYYQVIALRGKKTVIVRKIRGEVIDRSGTMSGTLKPVPGAFLGEAMTRRLKTQGGEVLIGIADYINAYLSSAEETHEFTSWA